MWRTFSWIASITSFPLSSPTCCEVSNLQSHPVVSFQHHLCLCQCYTKNACLLRFTAGHFPSAGYIHSRVEEEFLWDCKQLGAYSPIVLLNTLLFFCCKYFGFTKVEQHRQLSFAHVMRCTKTNLNNTKTTFLRFYPPLSGPEAESGTNVQNARFKHTELNALILQLRVDSPPKISSQTDSDCFHVQIILELAHCLYVSSSDAEGGPAKKRKEEESKEEILEMMENTENPLRCPVRLYEFYLSKW